MSAKELAKTINKRCRLYLDERTHRSFCVTRRRDYARPLNLPGYFAFTKYVWKTIWRHRRVFMSLVLLYSLVTITVIGISSQDNYELLTNVLHSTDDGAFGDNFGKLGEAGLVSIVAMTGGLSQSMTEAQQIYTGFIFLLVWLATVWLLRNLLAGHKVKLRDGLYNAGAPIIPTIIIFLLFIVQLIPFALALIGYSAASSSGLLDGGIPAMLFWVVDILLVTLSLYWVTSTFFALIIVTLPGMYPLKAIRTASDLVMGRRFRILLRLIWMIICVAVGWLAICVPVVLIDGSTKGVLPSIKWIPIVPLTITLLSSLTIVWVSGYIYLLYRKVVANDASTA
jgi:hypothetical protein